MASSLLLLAIIPALFLSVALTGNPGARTWQDCFGCLFQQSCWGRQDLIPRQELSPRQELRPKQELRPRQNWRAQQAWLDWEDLWRRYGLLEDVSEYVVPNSPLKIRFGDKEVKPGEEISFTTALLEPPRLSWNCDKNKYYTVIFANCDALGSNQRNQYLHWKVEGISNCDQDSGTTTMMYSGPKPLPLSGAPRYVFLIFQFSKYQPSNLLSNVVQSSAGRLDQSLHKYIVEYGNFPHAGSFFTMRFPVLANVDVLSGTSKLPLAPATDGLTGAMSKI